MISPKGKRIFAWGMVILMILVFVVPAISTMASADDDIDLKDRIAGLSDTYEQLQKQQNELQTQINKTKNEKNQKLAVQEQLSSQMAVTAEQISVLEKRISILEENIEKKEWELQQKQKEIDKNYELFRQRFRAMCSTGKTTTLGLVLGVDDFSQLLTRTEVVTRIAEHDNDLIATLVAEKEELKQIKSEIESNQESLENDKTEIATKKEELNIQFTQAEKQVQDIAALEQKFLSNQKEIQEQMKKVQGEIDRIYAQINEASINIPYVGGEMKWPTPTLGQITSNYGYRFGGSDFHTGIDISGAGAYGASINCANTGTVAFVNTAVTPGYGYGKYVIVDHGGGISTLYAHCNSINVSVGDVVSRGQNIAQVGSTGWSTGPHLHFEVRVNGKSVNPIGYLS